MRQKFTNSQEELNSVTRLHEKCTGKRAESCEWCNQGTREHNWPEDRVVYVPNQTFRLSTSNFEHKACLEPEPLFRVNRESRKSLQSFQVKKSSMVSNLFN